MNVVQLLKWDNFYSTDPSVQGLVQNENQENYADKTRVYYNSFWISEQNVQRLVSNVCITHARRDTCMTSIINPEDLLSLEERMQARKKVITMRSTIYAVGGCGPFLRQVLPKHLQTEILILFSPTIDWDLRGLDAETFFIIHNRMPKQRILHIGNDLFLDDHAYAACIAEDVTLLLMAAEEEQFRQKRDKKLWIKLTPLGIGHGVYLWNGIHIGPFLIRAFFHGVLSALNALEWKKIGAVEIVDITKQNALTPLWPSKVNNIHIVTKRKRDVLDFRNSSICLEEDDTVLESDFDAALVCPGDVFAYPGNEFYDTCVNSMIGNNTSMRRMGNPLHNTAFSKKDTYVPIRVPASNWWPARCAT